MTVGYACGGCMSGCLISIALLLVNPPESIPLAVNTEIDPETRCLIAGQFKCPGHNECLKASQWCNFRRDCEGGEDEERCGSSCDFDEKWPYEDRPCSAWNLSASTDGKPGFQVVEGSDTAGTTDWGDMVRNGLPPVHNPPALTEGRYALFVNHDHKMGSKATLGSPWFGSSGPQCHINFTINMFGTNVGHLRLNLLTDNGVDREVWYSHSDKGSRWLTYTVPFGAITKPFRFEFRVTRGLGDNGHFALDNIFLDSCSHDLAVQRQCHLQEFTCDTTVCIPLSKVCDLQNDCLNGEDEDSKLCGDISEGAACTFEGGLCDWTNYSSSRFHWARHSGSTPTNNTGPTKDHTTGTQTGYYIYFEASGRQLGDRAMIVSRVYPIPPASTWDPDSPYYQSCQIRFFYHMYGIHVHQLKMHVSEVYIDGTPEIRGRFYENYWVKAILGNNRGVDAWLRVAVPIPRVGRRFVLMFEGIRGLRFQGDIAIDDVTLSPECFGKGILVGTSSSFETITEVVNKSTRFSFKTCANSGPEGPTEYQCRMAYKFTDKKVTVLTAKDQMAGVQVWTVPESNMYSITALGASGGTGVGNPDPSKGAYAHAKFNLTAGEKIYMLVGQKGESACSQTNKKNSQTSQICHHGIAPHNPSDGQMRKLVGVGGGGGGGTFIFKRDPITKNITILIIAGGGGGKAFQLGYDPIRANGGLSIGGPGSSPNSPIAGPGAGGGLRGFTNQSQAGQPLEQGGLGGKPCPKARTPYGWEISGGFGGGGGACTAGGGGGGYTGGNVSQTDNWEHNGQGGSSYISPDGIDPIFEPGTNRDDGEVEIAFVLDCPCEFMCIYQNYQKKQFKCYCAPNFILDEDGLHCIDPRRLTPMPPTKIQVSRLVASVIGGLIVLIIVILFIFCIVHRFSKKKLEAVRLDMLSSPDYQLDRLRSNAGTPGLLTAYNPNYDFGGSKCTLQDLREIQRDHLTLVRALGQGAFGEVYQGYLSHVQRDTSDLPVAVKTLPALCTNQAEMDFLMEALIMSKFNHSNIVRFIGVCFEKHPRFIVLELLEGGDLKSFLRESRPKPRQPSRVTMVDLVELSLDIAQGCLYLEENHFIHRDIAARNCLLTKKGPGRVAKIADFGMARDIYRADYYRKGGKAMLPVKWMPPEAFLDGIFTLKTDIWSFGILLWEVFSLGYMPYPGRGNQEVMQLVTAGGRLDPPKNCPSPVYHIMGLCWHGIPERRPNFSTMIEKLQACLQDPGVIHSPLPVFHRPPSVERDTTIMRPRDPDRMVLTVEPPRKYVEPDSPNSLMQLIGPQSPDYREGTTTEPSMHQLKKANGNGSAESLDKLLLHEDKLTGSPQYGNVFNYDSFISDACLPPPGSRAAEVQFSQAIDQTGEKGSKSEDRMSADGASRCNDSDSELSCSGPGRVNTMDSGKGSLDSFPREMGSAARLEGGTYVPGDSATLPSSIARSRPSPKKPVTERSSLLSLDKSHPKLQPCRSGDTLATTSSPSLDMRTSDDGKSLYVNIPAQTDSVDGDYPHRLNRWSGDSSDGDRMVVTTSSSDPGDSGVVIDLREGAATRLCAEKTDC